jgi:PmbA protein
MSELLDLAHDVVKRAQALGADQVSATVSQGSHTTITRRDGRVEQATEATTRGLSVSLFVDERYSSHSTSDLRPDALQAFLERAVAATRFLEPDPERALPDAALCGRGSSEAELDQDDPGWGARTPEERAALAVALEEAARAHEDDRQVSASIWCADGRSTAGRVLSNGFAGEHTSAGFSIGVDMTLDDGQGGRPEAGAGYGARHLADLPAPDQVAAEALDRVRERVGAGPTDSGRYPLVLQNRTAGRLLGILGGPLSGGSLYERRSCLADKLGETLGSPLFTLVDDPTVPRGLGSRPWDGDALVARPRTVFREGVLESYYINVYYGRKLGMDPTSGSRSNWVIPPGDRPWSELVAHHPKAILVQSFLGGNANPITGDFSFGIRGMLLEHGQPTRSLSEMNVSGNLLELLQRLVGVGDDPWTYSAARLPTLVFEDVDFSGT